MGEIYLDNTYTNLNIYVGGQGEMSYSSGTVKPGGWMEEVLLLVIILIHRFISWKRRWSFWYKNKWNRISRSRYSSWRRRWWRGLSFKCELLWRSRRRTIRLDGYGGSYAGTGGTQSEGGLNGGVLGVGGNGGGRRAGGGGGYYGGGAGRSNYYPGGGGSSYIGGMIDDGTRGTTEGVRNSDGQAKITPVKLDFANPPVLAPGMTAVKWNGTTWDEVADPINDTSWYSYTHHDKSGLMLGLQMDHFGSDAKIYI